MNLSNSFLSSSVLLKFDQRSVVGGWSALGGGWRVGRGWMTLVCRAFPSFKAVHSSLKLFSYKPSCYFGFAGAGVEVHLR